MALRILLTLIAIADDLLPNSAECKDLFRKLKNPYYVGDHPALTQTSGWVDAWTSAPSVYAVAAAKTQDVVAAVELEAGAAG